MTKDFPQQLVVETTAACDQHCIFCGRTYMERPKKTMQAELFERIVEEVGRESPDTELWPTFMGEALLLGERFFRLVRYARKVGCNKITLNSNGNRLTSENIEGLLDCGIDRFILSFDAFTKETYEKVRPGGRFERLQGGAHRLLDVMRKRGLVTPLVEMQFSVFDENEKEVEDFVQYWLTQGVVVKTRPKVHWSGTVSGDRPAENGRTPCLWAMETAAIHWNGNVVMCAIDCDGKYVAGNVARQSLKTIWNGPLAWLRELQQARRFLELPEICRKCPDWKVKKAVAHFPNPVMQHQYEDYIRRGRGEIQSAPR